MTEEQVKSQYRAIEAPRELRGRVLAACTAARKQRAGRRKRIASMAACFVVVLALSVYGFSPAPAVSCGGQTIGRGGVTVAAETVALAGAAAQPRTAMAFSIEPATVGDTVEDCVRVTFERKTQVSVDTGTLYRYDAQTEAATEAGTACEAAAGELLYWHIEGERAVLTARTGLRSAKIEAVRTDGGWTLSK